MEITNNILLNMMKLQLLNIYGKYETETESLDDPALRKAYYSLETVTDHDDMKQWGKLLESLGLDYTNLDGAERPSNYLAELDDLASRADWSVMHDFISWKCSFAPSEWGDIIHENCERVKRIQQMADRAYDVHIFLVLCGNQWVAIGNDADRLFEIFGWQTSTIYNGEQDVPFMFINDYGWKVLSDSGYSINFLHLSDEEEDDEVFFSDCFNEDMVCANQQLVDYIRLLLRKHETMRDFTSEKASFFIPRSGYDYLINGNIHIDGDRVSVTTDEFKELTLADGRSWRLDEVGLPYIMNIRPVIGEA